MATITQDLDLAALGAWGNARVPGALFWTVSGSHLYGFPSADSDIDLRGCFLAPLRSLVGLRPPTETVEPKGEFGTLTAVDVSFHAEQLDAWEKRLLAAYEASTLPTEAPADELDRFLVELRLPQ